MNIESSEDAARLARQIVERDTRITTLIEELRAQDMLGLECAQTIELEKLSAKNAAAAPILARWFADQTCPSPTPAPRGQAPDQPRPRAPGSLPDSAPSSIQIGGNRVTAVMLEAAEDLLHTLTTGERTLPSDLYEVIARAFSVTRDDAKERLLLSIYGRKGAPVTAPVTPSPEEPSA